MQHNMKNMDQKLKNILGVYESDSQRTEDESLEENENDGQIFDESSSGDDI